VRFTRGFINIKAYMNKPKMFTQKINR